MSQHNSNRPPTVRVDVRMLVPMAAILIAPFIGFLLSPNLALGILVICLGVVGWMTWEVAKGAPAAQARTMRLGAMLNGVLAVAALVLLVVRL